MKTKLLASIALLGLSMGTAQAVTLNYSDSHTFDGEVDYFYFNNNSAGSVSLWTDTLQDGFDSNGALFKLNAGTGSYDWVRDIGNGTEVLNTDGLNIADPVTGIAVNVFGTAIKNGYVSGESEKVGVSDTGGTYNLDAGSYLFTVAGFDFIPWASFLGGGTVDDGFLDVDAELFGIVNPERQWSTWTFNTGGVASPYEVYIEGDVSSVSVPAAVWLFATAITGLGVMRKSKQKI